MSQTLMAYLTCEKFDATIYDAIAQRYKSSRYKDIIVINLQEDEQIVLFSFGVCVCWNLSFDNAKFFLDFIAPFQIQALEQPQYEELMYTYGESFKLNFDQLVMDNRSQLAKIAISTSLAQNLKLQQFEVYVQQSIESNAQFPKQLHETGKIHLGKKETAKKMGELFLVKSRINLHYDLLDTPEFFWEYPEYEPYYEQLSKYLEIKPRLDVLNKKLEVIQELFDMLSNEQNHRYSSFLEWIIIILIAIEIVMGLYDHFWK